MNNSSRFFENKECKYYPCHKDIKEMNCLFCYCPLYPLEHCPGNYQVLNVSGKTVKDCMGCTFPHNPENYDLIMSFLCK